MKLLGAAAALTLLLLASNYEICDAKLLACRGVGGPSNKTCELRPTKGCTAADVEGGVAHNFNVTDNEPPLCVTYVAKEGANPERVTLYRGTTPVSGADAPQTCNALCKRLEQQPGLVGRLLYFGCVKKTDGDFINFGMSDNNANSDYLTYLPLNNNNFKCPEEVQAQPLAWYQSAVIGVIGAGIVSIVVGALILYFGWIRSMIGASSVQPSAPPQPIESQTAF